MPQAQDRQTVIDDEHLKLLSIGYIISGILSAFGAVIGLMYAFVGVGVRAILQKAPAGNGQPPPTFIVWIFAAVGISIFLALATLAVVKFFTARCLKARKSRIFCMVVAGFSCLEFPYGTLLGVFSFMVLVRTSVIRMFDQIPASPTPAAPGAVAQL